VAQETFGVGGGVGRSSLHCRTCF